MIDSRLPDLGRLTLAGIRNHLDQDFLRRNEGGPDVVLRLVAAERVQRDPTAPADDSGRPFSLLFRGPADPRLTQGMHDLEHPELPLAGVFLVPVGGDGAGCDYEAVFS